MKKSISIHYFFLILLISFQVVGCSRDSIENRRKETMIMIIDALQKCDSVKLYNLIDTAFTFSFEGKKQFLKLKDRMCSDLNNSKIKKENFTLTHKIPSVISYEIPLPIQSDKFDSVVLIFKFNKNVYDLAYRLEMFWIFKNTNRNKLLIAPN